GSGIGITTHPRPRHRPDEDLKAELERLRNENVALKKGLLPIVASFLTSVLAFLAHRPHRPFFDFGKNRNRPTVKFQNFGNRNARFCRLGAKSMAGTGDFEGGSAPYPPFIGWPVLEP